MQSEEKAIIAGVSHGLKTLVDDSVNLTINIPPRHATECMKLFGKRGVNIALASLVDEVGLSIMQSELEEEVKVDYGMMAKELKLSGFFRIPLVWEAIGTDEEFLDWIKKQGCLISSGNCHGDIVPAHVRRVANGSGTAIKPPYSAVPLCDAHHKLQHQKGESVIGGKARMEIMRIRYLEEWSWHTLKQDLGHKSWKDVPPELLGEWCAENDLTQCLPYSYKEAING